MTFVTTPSLPETAERTSSFRASVGLFGLLIFGFFYHLHEEWDLNPHYFYGWGVPILGIILAQKRWNDRPTADFSGPNICWMFMTGAALVLWLPIRILREANMDWRLMQWAIAGGCVWMLFGAVYWSGGKAWLRHFAFPILFLWVAVPWPTRLETLLIQGSSELIVRGAVEVLRWMGIAAWSAGNIINLPETSVGVDEACSGLRSLQGSVMCALFLGELKRLSLPKRLLLVAIGITTAMMLNMIRTIGLTTVAAKQGVSAADLWHDGAGIATLAVTFAVLWVVTRFVPGGRVSRTEGETSFARPISPRVVIACAAWFVLVETASSLWYRIHEGERVEKLWSFERANADGLTPEEIPARVRSLLRFDEGAAFRRALPDGTDWWVCGIGWKRSGGGAPIARFHSPDVCLPAAGLKLVNRGATVFPVGPDLAFRSYQFERQGKPIFLFSAYHSATKAGAIQSVDEFDLTWRKRVQAALKGERPAEQKVFQVLISGAVSEQAARQAFEEFAKQTLRRGA